MGDHESTICSKLFKQSNNKTVESPNMWNTQIALKNDAKERSTNELSISTPLYNGFRVSDTNSNHVSCKHFNVLDITTTNEPGNVDDKLDGKHNSTECTIDSTDAKETLMQWATKNWKLVSFLILVLIVGIAFAVMVVVRQQPILGMY